HRHPAFTSFVGNSRARGGCRARELRLPPDLVPPDLVPTDLAAPPRRPTRRRRAPAAADVAHFFFRLRGDRWSSGVRGERSAPPFAFALLRFRIGARRAGVRGARS